MCVCRRNGIDPQPQQQYLFFVYLLVLLQQLVIALSRLSPPPPHSLSCSVLYCRRARGCCCCAIAAKIDLFICDQTLRAKNIPTVCCTHPLQGTLSASQPVAHRSRSKCQSTLPSSSMPLILRVTQGGSETDTHQSARCVRSLCVLVPALDRPSGWGALYL